MCAGRKACAIASTCGLLAYHGYTRPIEFVHAESNCGRVGCSDCAHFLDRVGNGKSGRGAPNNARGAALRGQKRIEGDQKLSMGTTIKAEKTGTLIECDPMTKLVDEISEFVRSKTDDPWRAVIALEAARIRCSFAGLPIPKEHRECSAVHASVRSASRPASPQAIREAYRRDSLAKKIARVSEILQCG